jgi:undecaprenyl diphosphate synthase
VDALPERARGQLLAAVETTSCNTGLLVNLAINYGGRTELVDAVNAILEEKRSAGCLDGVTEEDISAHLYTAGIPDPDLLVRTSGEMRVSNFLLWQIAYAELYVTSTLWPDFRGGDLLRAIADYQRRERRFGGLSAAPRLRPNEPYVPAAVGIPAQ